MIKNTPSEPAGLLNAPTTVQWWIVVRIEDYYLKSFSPTEKSHSDFSSGNLTMFLIGLTE
jgi:hypothetical protein